MEYPEGLAYDVVARKLGGSGPLMSSQYQSALSGGGEIYHCATQDLIQRTIDISCPPPFPSTLNIPKH